MQQADIARIRATIFGLVGCAYAGEVRVAEGAGLTVACHAQGARIVCGDLNALARGFFLLAQGLAQGQVPFTRTEHRRFTDCGAFLDVSCGAVLTVAAVKRYIDHMAALGMNLLMLYMEDTYTVPGYPYFGYLRGRYTQEELRALDDYAAGMGIELVPAIQTLGHLNQFLQWADSAPLRDTPACLLIDEPRTYAFLEAAITSLRACVRTRRLHIGMDEAHGVGLGRYHALHGAVDRHALLTRHLARVTALCQAQGFQPMMWSDMFFRLGSAHNDYYDPEAVVPQAVIDQLPDVDLVYWDYYHTDEAFYGHMLAQHARMRPRTVFAGGIWTWSGFLPNVALTRATMRPALRACARHGVNTVLATLWGDDSTETNYFLAASQLPLFSEACWRGADCADADIEAAGAFLTGLPAPAYAAFGAFYEGAADRRIGKALVYADLLYPLLPEPCDLAERAAAWHAARRALAPCLHRADCRYADALFALAARKAEVIAPLRARYLAGDREHLRRVAAHDIPTLIALTERVADLHKAQWEADCKRIGWEVLALRYGGLTGRLRDVQEVLLRWAEGRLARIEELDEVPLPGASRRGMEFAQVFMSPSNGY